MNSIEEVFEAYRKQMEFFVKWHAGCINAFGMLPDRISRFPSSRRRWRDV